MALIEKDYWKWDENSIKFWRNSTGICRKIKDHQHLTNDFHWAGKRKIPYCKNLSDLPKNKENFESSRKF